MLNQHSQAPWWRGRASLQADSYPRISFSSDSWAYSVLKRIGDVLVAAIVLALVAPIMAVIALAIKLDSPGPVLHIQRRTGRGGSTFRFYKFRSMTNGVDHTAEHRKFAAAYIGGQASLAGQDEDGHIMYKPATNGHRITRVGRWLRRTSLDELPQLLNVLKGDMSLVGPRPTMDYETEMCTDRHRQRLAVLPGITGWAQVNGRSGLVFDDIVTYDLEYVMRRSLCFDFWILVATIPVVLSAEHAG